MVDVLAFGLEDVMEMLINFCLSTNVKMIVFYLKDLMHVRYRLSVEAAMEVCQCGDMTQNVMFVHNLITVDA